MASFQIAGTCSDGAGGLEALVGGLIQVSVTATGMDGHVVSVTVSDSAGDIFQAAAGAMTSMMSKPAAFTANTGGPGVPNGTILFTFYVGLISGARTFNLSGSMSGTGAFSHDFHVNVVEPDYTTVNIDYWPLSYGFFAGMGDLSPHHLVGVNDSTVLGYYGTGISPAHVPCDFALVILVNDASTWTPWGTGLTYNGPWNDSNKFDKVSNSTTLGGSPGANTRVPATGTSNVSAYDYASCSDGTHTGTCQGDSITADYTVCVMIVARNQSVGIGPGNWVHVGEVNRRLQATWTGTAANAGTLSGQVPNASGTNTGSTTNIKWPTWPANPPYSS